MQIIIDNVDIQLLKKQRELLLELIKDYGLNVNQINTMDGLVNFIDHIADMAEGFGFDTKYLRQEAKSMNGTKCGICGDLQFNTPAGVTCGNGHGGADAKEE